VIRHIVSWRLATDDPAVRATQAASIKERLEGLAPMIPEVRAIAVHSDLGEIEGNYDVVLVADFDDTAGLATYANHPAHQVVAAYTRSVAAERAAVDFEV
jgi:hypothetical protein